MCDLFTDTSSICNKVQDEGLIYKNCNLLQLMRADCSEGGLCKAWKR